VANHDSNTIIKFAEDTTVVGLITDNDETVYREEVRELAMWWQDSNFFLNVSKTKELIVDYRKRWAGQAPINIDGAVVERVESFKILGVHITNELSWSKTYQDSREEGTTKPFPPQETEKIWHGSAGPQNVLQLQLQSILTSCITTWYGNCLASDRKALQRVVQTAQYITGAKLPAIQDLQLKFTYTLAKYI
jgi:hypothetical protein